jgi:hypothetical protein
MKQPDASVLYEAIRLLRQHLNDNGFFAGARWDFKPKGTETHPDCMRLTIKVDIEPLEDRRSMGRRLPSVPRQQRTQPAKSGGQTGIAERRR